MRAMSAAWIVTVLGLSVALCGTAQAQDKKGRPKPEAEKVELKDVPEKVLATAKKEAPNAEITTAEKTSQKKRGTLFLLSGKDGKFEVSFQIESSGDLLRYTKSVEKKRKKGS